MTTEAVVLLGVAVIVLIGAITYVIPYIYFDR